MNSVDPSSLANNQRKQKVVGGSEITMKALQVETGVLIIHINKEINLKEVTIVNMENPGRIETIKGNQIEKEIGKEMVKIN